MASLVEELISVLKEETKLYEFLIELGEKKRQILIDADITALEALTGIEQAKSDELLSFSNKQGQLLSDIKMVVGKKEEEITVTSLICLLNSQPQVQGELIKVRDDLMNAATEMQKINRQNEELLKVAMELTEYDITLFKSMRQAPETANYNKSAYNTGTLLGSSGFDAKQ